MADTIREQIIAAIEARLAIILTAKAFATNCGSNVFRVRHHLDPDSELPASVIWPMPEEVERDYGKTGLILPVRVELLSAHGAAEPSALSEQMLGDGIEAMTGSRYTIAFTSGGTEEVSAGDTVTGATSEATALVEAVSLSAGAWDDGDAAGTLTMRRKSGAFTDGENLNTANQDNIATVDGSVTVTSPVDLVCGGLADDIDYVGGGTEEYPDEDERITAVSVLFHIRYATRAGNPFAQ